MITYDARTVRGKFKPSKDAERKLYQALKRVAQASGHIVDLHVDGAKIVDIDQMNRSLREYAHKLDPWARRQAATMLKTVADSNKLAYWNKARSISSRLGKFDEDESAMIAIDLLTEQVELIKSIPIEAGLRAQQIAFEAALHGQRAVPDQDTINELQKQLGMSTEVATSRAQLIAVTETARSNSAINQSRAMSSGSLQYRWHNSGDSAVRDSHRVYKGKRMQGQIFRWDDPPTLDDGTRGHPGTFPRCRCFAEPIFPDE